VLEIITNYELKITGSEIEIITNYELKITSSELEIITNYGLRVRKNYELRIKNYGYRLILWFLAIIKINRHFNNSGIISPQEIKV
jgi:hypothetical protein